MNKLLTFLLCLFAIAPALAAGPGGGPGPTPSPWVLNGAQIYYAQGCVTVSVTQPGACNGVGSFNADTIYLNNVALGTAAIKNIGTSGATVPLLSTANTWSLRQTITAGGFGVTAGGLSLGTATTQTGGAIFASAISGNVANVLGLSFNSGAIFYSFGPNASTYNSLVLQQIHSDNSGSRNVFSADASGNVGVGVSGSSFTSLASPNYLSQTSTNPILFFNRTDQATDQKNWGFSNVSADFWGYAENDAINANTPWIKVGRGTTYNVASQDFFTSSAAGTPINRLSFSQAGSMTVTPATGRFILVNPANPTYQLDQSGAGVDLKNWDILTNASNLNIQATNDGLSSATIAYQITRGTTYNIANHIWYTSTSAASPVQQMQLSASSLTVVPTVIMAGTTALPAASLVNALEPNSVSATVATGTINFDFATQSTVYYTSNASANWTVNFRFSSGTTLDSVMATGQMITGTFWVTQGGTAFFNNAVQVNGTTSGVTTKWLGGAPAAGNISGIDVYTYAITKTGSAAFTILASLAQFK